eukprot:1103477-Pelagomonas_calceolata.AAC.10
MGNMPRDRQAYKRYRVVAVALAALEQLYFLKQGKGYLALRAYEGSLAAAKTMPVTKPVRAGEEKQKIYVSHSITGTLTRTWQAWSCT